MSLRKLSTSAAAFILALSLAACGSPSQNSSEPNSDAVSSTAESSSALPSEQETAGQELAGDAMVFGTATLTYAEFYSGDVSSTDNFDAVTSATTSKYEIMANMSTDFVDETANAEGYHITGVKNVNVAVPASELEAYQAVNDSFAPIEGEAPTQYKTVKMEGNKAVYSATQFNIADTVTDATAELQTGTNWGDYQINVTDGTAVHLRNTREDEGFDIGSEIQGIILETDSGLKVGMEHLQSIWVQPYEVSFNVLADNTHNTHISGFDNLPELSKLVGETVTKITYIMPDSAYVYEFDGIYIKPLYEGTITATVSDSYDSVTLSTSDFSAFEKGKLTVTYTLGSGRSREVTTLLETELADGTADYVLEVSAIDGLEAGGTYGAVISSDTYADITVALPISSGQEAALETLIASAKEKLAVEPDNATLQEHLREAEELLANTSAASDEAGSLISELTQLTSNEAGRGERGGH
ncbi:hypothetical protein I5Q82_11150 [Acutalibacter muris]|uniref:Uncharacterized protein n=1 Tax=Acutalibacter muris TaxID=1796620 RepID=A0A1Z2XLS2_9FIRM|nr:hypothetical protein [Acutalibacter muris]ANU53939.1 hypothetical protein A4V00_07815 [Hungateiclostridiaceae bacterium KB18]ASB39382.1 hypothetical protein ADH66_01145 [Acutalibacter muris]QQR28675.1 hypothetical protein I5Q82_11150 [Acutalibacter muris]